MSGYKIDVDLEPFAKADGDTAVGDFNISLDIEHDDRSIEPIEISGKFVIIGEKRYILFKTIESADSVLGKIQRQVAQINKMRMVDKELYDKAKTEMKSLSKSK